MKSIFQKKNREKESQENQILKNLEKNREIEFKKKITKKLFTKFNS